MPKAPKASPHLAASDPAPELVEGELVEEPNELVPEASSDERALVPARLAARSLARLDPLQLYIQDLRRFPLLSREEEHELAVRYANTGDLTLARRLVTANLRLVVKIAHEYRRAHRNLLDLIQEGNIGLLQAVEKYDPYRGVKLSSYAAWWIRAYMLKFILSNWRLVKIGTTQAQRKLFFNLKKEKDKLEALGFDSSTAALAKALDVPESEVVDMERRLGQGELSLDAPVGREEGSRTHLDEIAASARERPDVRAEGDEFRAVLRKELERFRETLSGRERALFEERLFTETPKTLQELGERYGISRERARQLEKRLTDKLRDHLRGALGDSVQVAMGLDE